MMPETGSGSKSDRFSVDIEHIERSVFYTNRKMVLLHVVSALASFALSFFITEPYSLLAAPFYVYSGACLLLIVFALRRMFVPHTIIAIKLLLDALLTVYWIDVNAWKTGSTMLFFLPVIILHFVFLYNIRVSGFVWFHCTIYAIVLINGVIFLLLSSSGVHQALVGGAVYFLMAILTIIAHITNSRFKMLMHEEMKSREERIDSFVNSRKTFSLSARIVNHEISNELMSLSHCVHLLKHRKTESFVREIDDIKRCMDSIPKYLKMLSEQQSAPTGLLAVLKVVFPGKHASVDVDGDVVVNVPMLLLVSFVNNTYENALQAYERKFGNDEGFHIDVTFDGAALIIEDNAGGFDVSAIALGNSNKGAGHGIFLATFLNDTRHLGLRPSIERTELGTRVKIFFDTIEKTNP